MWLLPSQLNVFSSYRKQPGHAQMRFLISKRKGVISKSRKNKDDSYQERMLGCLGLEII